MALDVKNVLRELGFKPEQIDELAPKFEAGHLQALESRYADPAKVQRLNTLEAAEQKLNEANDRLNTELAEWAQLTQAEKAANSQLRDEAERSQQEVLRLTQTVTRLAQTAGVDPATVLPKASDTPVVTPKGTTMPDGFDPNKYVTAENHSALARFNMHLPSKLLKIAREHHALTGEDLDTDSIISEIEANAGKRGGVVDPIQIWEKQHDIPAKREAKRQEKYQSEIRAAEERGYERARTDEAISPTTTPGRHSPVLIRRSENGQFQPRESALKRPQPEGAVRDAAAAFKSGKYRQDKRSAG